MTDHRTVALDRDLTRVREWIDQAVRHAVNEAAQAFNAIRYWCDQTEADTKAWLEKHNPDCECEVGETRLEDVAAIRALLPELPTVGAVSVEGGVDMGTRVTLRGGEAGDAAFGGSETDGGSDSGNREGDRAW